METATKHKLATKPGNTDTASLAAALEHAREMANFAAEVRMRNFNFFLVIGGALAAGYVQMGEQMVRMALGIAGVLLSLLFLGLDIRGHQLVQRATRHLDAIEPVVWAKAGLPTPVPYPHTGRLRMLTHAWIYRTLFGVVGVASATSAVLQLFQ
jgi:hypothetical protein